MSLHATVEKMSKMMDEMGLTELTIEQSFLFGVWKKEFKLSKQGALAASAPVFTANTAPKSLAGKSDADAPVAVSENALRSPMVGVVYLGPEPGAKPFVAVGGKVKPGDTLCLIEAMKTFNPVKSEIVGTVKEILVKDAQTVEYDTPLIVIE
jgi:acetyl-CoA carboxylase biotin carboxyl carrier protein